MKILIINGSPRRNGATGQILSHMNTRLRALDASAEIEMVHLGEYNMKPCVGCFSCYKTGACPIGDDGLEELSHRIENCDGVVFGSPTYASNVSGTFKILMDRGHFVFEQLLRNKACFSVVTYENYGGRAVQKILGNLIHFSGGALSGQYREKLNHGTNAVDTKTIKALDRKCAKFLKSVNMENPLTKRERILRFFVFNFGLRPHVMKNHSSYQAVADRWAAQ